MAISIPRFGILAEIVSISGHVQILNAFSSIHTYILLLMLPKKGFSAQYNTITNTDLNLKLIKNISIIIITINMSKNILNAKK